MARPAVTICIPAWNAEAFIDRTLRCARDQTFADVVIRVSIDLSDDGTHEICMAHAAEDDRIEVVSQTERLGWAGNANALFDMVETDYAFLYFHDDEIDPRYTAVLLDALRAEPDAVSAHCDYEGYGRASAFEPAHTYAGRDAHRILSLFVGPEIGTGLRSMIRRDALESGLRFPIIGVEGPWRAWPFLLRLVALGPAIGVHELLYRRWLRDDSLTTTWHPRSIEDLIGGQREQAELSLSIIESTDSTGGERDAMRFGLLLHMLPLTRRTETRLRQGTLMDPARISEAFASLPSLEAVVAEVDLEVAGWIRSRYADLLTLEGRHARLVAGRRAEASEKLRRALQVDPDHAQAMAELALTLVGEDDEEAAALARRALATDPALAGSVLGASSFPWS